MFWATSLHQCDHCIGGRKLFIVVAVQSSVFSGLFTFAIFILLILVVFLDGLVGIVADIPMMNASDTSSSCLTPGINTEPGSVIHNQNVVYCRVSAGCLCRDRPSLETHHHHSALEL